VALDLSRAYMELAHGASQRQDMLERDTNTTVENCKRSGLKGFVLGRPDMNRRPIGHKRGCCAIKKREPEH